MSKSNCFCITTLYDWLKKPVPLFHPIKSKSNRDLLTYVFRRIASAPRIYFEFWLVRWISASFVIGQSDYFGFIWRYSLKTASTVLVRCVLQLEKLIEKNYYLHKSAREAYRSYLQAYASHQHKTIFNVSALDLQRVAPAFGFLVPPRVNLSILLIVVLTLLTAFLMFWVEFSRVFGTCIWQGCHRSGNGYRKKNSSSSGISQCISFWVRENWFFEETSGKIEII